MAQASGIYGQLSSVQRAGIDAAVGSDLSPDIYSPSLTHSQAVPRSQSDLTISSTKSENVAQNKMPHSKTIPEVLNSSDVQGDIQDFGSSYGQVSMESSGVKYFPFTKVLLGLPQAALAGNELYRSGSSSHIDVQRNLLIPDSDVPNDCDDDPFRKRSASFTERENSCTKSLLNHQDEKRVAMYEDYGEQVAILDKSRNSYEELQNTLKLERQTLNKDHFITQQEVATIRAQNANLKRIANELRGQLEEHQRLNAVYSPAVGPHLVPPNAWADTTTVTSGGIGTPGRPKSTGEPGSRENFMESVPPYFHSISYPSGNLHYVPHPRAHTQSVTNPSSVSIYHGPAPSPGQVPHPSGGSGFTNRYSAGGMGQKPPCRPPRYPPPTSPALNQTLPHTSVSSLPSASHTLPSTTQRTTATRPDPAGAHPLLTPSSIAEETTDKWQCEHCTFLNDSVLTCEMCNFPRNLARHGAMPRAASESNALSAVAGEQGPHTASASTASMHGSITGLGSYRSHVLTQVEAPGVVTFDQGASQQNNCFCCEHPTGTQHRTRRTAHRESLP